MAQLNLVNRSGRAIKIGDYVKFHPQYKDSFIYTELGDANIIGTAAAEAYPGRRCLINPLNTFDILDIINQLSNVYQPLNANLTRLADYRRIGGDTHYTQFDATGHQTMVGNARPWRDELGDALTLYKNGVGITTDLAEGTQDFDYNAAYNANPALADFLYKNVQLNHDKDLSATIYPHIHWFQGKNYIPNFLFEYRWQLNGIAKVTSWTKLKCQSLAYTYTSGIIPQIAYSTGIAVPPNATLSDVVQFRIFRDTTNASGEFTGVCPYNTGGNASVPVLSFDCHFMLNSLGSTDELHK